MATNPMTQAMTHGSQRFKAWSQAALVSSATLVGALSLLSVGSARASLCAFDSTGFVNCTYGDQWPGGGPGDLATAGPNPPLISAPYLGQWLDTQYTNYFPTDKQVKYIKAHQNSSGVSIWLWSDTNGNGFWQIPPDPHSEDIWANLIIFNPNLIVTADSFEYMVRITEPGYRFEDVGLTATLTVDATVKKDIYTVVNGGKGSLIGSLTYDSSTSSPIWLSLHLYQDLYIIDTLDPGTLGEIFDYANGFRQEVPGPLPVLAAGAAFGFSRKLRRRLKASRLSPTA